MIMNKVISKLGSLNFIFTRWFHLTPWPSPPRPLTGTHKLNLNFWWECGLSPVSLPRSTTVVFSSPAGIHFKVCEHKLSPFLPSSLPHGDWKGKWHTTLPTWTSNTMEENYLFTVGLMEKVSKVGTPNNFKVLFFFSFLLVYIVFTKGFHCDTAIHACKLPEICHLF
jgi:hypothetical protein